MATASSQPHRKIMVRITNKGVQLFSKMRSKIANDLTGIIAGLGEDQVDAPAHTKRAIKSRSIS
jgi:DNA-binding MarR family transcriptional regulator